MPIECQERDGIKVRDWHVLTCDPASILALETKLATVPSFLSKDPRLNYETLLDPNNTIYLIDDVGAILFIPRKEFTAEGHVTFWDRKLRGRVGLAQAITREYIRSRGLQEGRIVTAVPRDRHAVIAFCRRIGFKVAVDGPKALVLTYDVRIEE